MKKKFSQNKLIFLIFRAAFIVFTLLQATLVLSLQSLPAHAFALSTSSIWSSKIAAEILKQGGNAIDATVAASFMLNVVQPYNMGIGGGGILVVTENGKASVYNHREMAPKSAQKNMFQDEKDPSKSIAFWPDRVSLARSVATPGTVMGLYQAHKKFGKLPWKKLLSPAIERAEKGIRISKNFEKILKENWPRLIKHKSSAELFSSPQFKAYDPSNPGEPLSAGELYKNPELAKTLRKIAQNPLSFYHGRLAEDWIKAAQTLHVPLTLEDTKGYFIEETQAIEFEAFGHLFLTAMPPSAAAVMLGKSLRFLDHYYEQQKLKHKILPHSAERIHIDSVLLSTMQKLRNQTIADHHPTRADLEKLLNPSASERVLWDEIKSKIIQNNTSNVQPHLSPATNTATVQNQQSHSHTTHLSIVDDQNMAVSYSTTIEQWFGSAIVVPKHGFLLNNEMTDFDDQPESINAPAPNKRPRSNMSPIIILSKKDRSLLGVLGCAGGPRIPTTLVQILENYFIFGLKAKEASAFLRSHPNHDILEIEPALEPREIEKLKKMGHQVQLKSIESVAQVLLRRDSQKKWETAAESRSDSFAIDH